MRIYTADELPQHLESGEPNPDWLALRGSRFTGSEFYLFMSLAKKNELSETAESKLYEKALASLGYETETGFTSAAMERGTELESVARELYKAETFNDVQEVGFVDYESLRAGCSPDGVIYHQAQIIDDIEWHKDENGELQMSIGKPRTLVFTMSDQIDKIIEIKCLPDDAQILTPKGFVDIKTIKNGDVVAQYTQDGKIEFVKNLGVLHEKYKGELYNFYRYNKLTMSCTPTHRVVYYSTYKNKLAECLAKDFPKKSNRKILVGGYVGGKKNITADMRFCIATNADGHLTSNKTIVFDFSKQRKIIRLVEILKELGFEYKIVGERTFNNPKWNPSKRIIVKVPNAKSYKQGLNKMCDLTKISTAQAEKIIQEIALWDGTIGRSKTIAYTSMDKADVDFVAAICVIANRKSNVCAGSNGSYMITISGYGVQSKKNMAGIGFSENNTGQKIKTEPYCGSVHCVKVPSGMFVARMPNACAFITGNCPNIKNYVRMAMGKIPTQYVIQCQYNMLITGAKSCDFVVYHPDMALSIQEIHPDEQIQSDIKVVLEKLNARYDEILAQIQQYRKKD